MHPLNEASDLNETSDTAESSSRRTGRREKAPRRGLALVIEPERLGICRLPAKARIPVWVHRSAFFSVSRSREELSIVCEETLIPKSISCEAGWQAIRVKEPLDPTLIGVLASLANPLTKAGVSIFSISTFETDYLLVRQKKLGHAKEVLEAAGHCFVDETSSGGLRKSKREAAPTEAAPVAPAPVAPAPVAPAPVKAASADSARAERAPRKRRSRRSDELAGDVKPGGDDKPVLENRTAPDQRTESDPRAYRGKPLRRRPTKVKDKAASDPRDSEKKSSNRSADAARESIQQAVPTDQQGIADSAEAFRDQSTRRKTLRSSERQQRLSQALRQFGAALTNDPRFGEPDPSGSTSEASPEVSETAEEDSSGADGTTVDETAVGKAAVTQSPASPVEIVAADGEELDLDWESELVAADSPPAPESEKKSFVASSSGAFQGESLTLREEAEDEDESEMAEGMFTGAIPQGDVEVLDQSFATLGLSDEVLEAVRGMGFEHPTPIQAAVIPEALDGADIIGLAETGSGKTAAFVLPLAERLSPGKGVRGLILCPTREIALQTKAFIDTFGKHHKLKAVAVIGGVKMQPQIDQLNAKPDILVATPGRLADHMRRRNVDLRSLEELVIDEADHMLDLGFLPQIREILEQVPRKRRSMMFSATMLPAIERLAQQFMKDPLTIDIRPVNKVAEGIEHRLYLVHDAELKTCLLKLLDEVQGSTLIFARRKLHTEWLARQLQVAGCPSDRIHSDRTQAQRVRALRGFREGKFRILVATDVAARGIDVPRIQHVINYGLPESVEDYVHRAGRTARGNSVGIVSSIGTWQDKATVREIEASLGITVPRCSLEGIEAYVERPRRKTVRRRRML